MASNFKLILLCILILSSFNFPTAKAQDPNPTFVSRFCTANQTVANTTYQMDLRILFSSLSSNATTKTFYNNTVAGRNSSDTVYGLFMCRGDAPPELCRQCVVNATQRLSSDSECSLSKEAVIWYDECMVRYSNISFFTTVAVTPALYLTTTVNISNQESFKRLLFDTMNQTADEAANSPIGNRYATKEANISGGFQRLYCLAQCTQDLSPQACTTCFDDAIGSLPSCCEGKQGGRVLFPSCNIRYELYPFYRVTNETTGGLVPETKYPQIDSKYSEDPGYISRNCPSNETIAADGAFQSNLKTLLSALSSNATSVNEFQLEVGTLYGLFTCRGDISLRLCGQCVQNATEKIISECRSSKEAVIWYNHCWLRYSHRNFFSTVDTSPRYEGLNITNSSNIEQNSVTTLSTNLAKMANETGNKGDRYQKETLKLNDYQTLYILAQCTRGLSSSDCGVCLVDMIGSAIPWSRLGSVGGRVLYPSCNLRFELFQFYDLTEPTALPTGFYNSFKYYEFNFE